MAGTNYQLTMQVGPNPGKVFPLDKPEMVIGRDLTVDIVIIDTEVSRKHAHLVAQQGGYVIEDLGSTNGTEVNGTRLTSPYLLRPGEEINFGEHVTMVFETVPYDPEATQISPGTTPQRTPANLVEAAPRQPPPVIVASAPLMDQFPDEPQPPYQPQPVFAGQVPAGPVQAQPELPKKRFPTWLIILIVALLLVICVCGVSIYVIDTNNLWCTLFPFLPGCP